MRSPYASSIADNVYSVAPANDGGVWIGTHSSGAFHWNDHQLSQLKNAYTFTWSIMEDPRGIVWTGTYGRGVKRHFQNQVSVLGNPEIRSLSFLVDSQDRVWTGGDYGIQCLAGDEVHRYIPPSFNKVGSEWVVSLAEAPDGAIWMGTKLGYLHKFTQNGFETLLTPGDGRAYPICGLHFGPAGALWLVRYGFGLSRIADGQVSHFARAEGLPTTTVNGILNDPRGFLWFTSKQGVYRIGHDAFARFAGGEGRASDWQRFTEQDGLPSNSCHGEQNQPSLCLTEDGRVWVPTLNGVGVINPNELPDYARPPSVVIQEVTRFGEDESGVTMFVDGESATQPDGKPKSLSIPPGSNNLRIRYTAIDFTEPTEVNFSYRLVGLDDRWVDAENERAALVAGLGSGSYRFELRARNHLGQTSEVVSLGMVVQPFWWEKTSFRLAVVAMFVLAGFVWYRVRIGQLQQRSLVQAAFSRQLIEREESERKRIAQELHDSLGHELLLVRNRALDGANRSELPAVQAQFSDISELAGNALENARGMAYNLRPFELDRIGFRKAVETMISKTASVSGTRYFKDIDELDGVLSSVQLLYLYRLIQEGLNNILKHAQASVVMLEVKVEDQHVRVQLDDNGVGFDSKVAKSGMGLNGMEERAKLIGGDFRVDSAQGEGTRVRIEIPV